MRSALACSTTTQIIFGLALAVKAALISMPKYYSILSTTSWVGISIQQLAHRSIRAEIRQRYMPAFATGTNSITVRFFGLGVAAHDGETKLVQADKKALGSTLLFHIPAEVGYRFSEHYSASIYF